MLATGEQQRPESRGEVMAELVHQYADHKQTDNGSEYVVRVYGQERPDDSWEAWLEFAPVGEESTRRTDRETVQSTREAVSYWASGLESTYLETALRRSRPVNSDILAVPS